MAISIATTMNAHVVFILSKRSKKRKKKKKKEKKKKRKRCENFLYAPQAIECFCCRFSLLSKELTFNVLIVTNLSSPVHVLQHSQLEISFMVNTIARTYRIEMADGPIGSERA